MESRTNSAQQKLTMNRVIIIGDSMTDRGQMNEAYLCGLIPMSYVTGLAGKSPDGSFTNGLAWSDHFSAMLSTELAVDLVRKKQKWVQPDDISDAYMTNEGGIRDQVQQAYDLDDSRRVKFQGENIVLTKAIGGMTSHDWSWHPSCSVSRFFTRLILTNLDQIRANIFEHDKKHNRSRMEKLSTLVIEWTGANDLVTVNAEPTKHEARKAVDDRIKNIDEMVRQGYYRFVLVNMPDLSKTPRFQALSQKEQDKAQRVSEYFNQYLVEQIQEIKVKYPGITVDVFDVYTELKNIYDHPEQFGFDPAKLKKPYVKSDDFKMEKNGTSPAKGYLFWDELHPTADAQALLAEAIYKQFNQAYHFELEQDHPALQESLRTQSAPSLLR